MISVVTFTTRITCASAILRNIKSRTSGFANAMQPYTCNIKIKETFSKRNFMTVSQHADISLLTFIVNKFAQQNVAVPSISNPHEKQGTLENLAALCPFKLLGSNDIEYAEIQQWTCYALETVAAGLNDLSAQKTFSKFLNESLKGKVFLAANSMSLADLVLYANLHSYMAQMVPKRRSELCNLTRWFDLIQHQDVISGYGSLQLVDIDLDFAGTEKQLQPPNQSSDIQVPSPGNKSKPKSDNDEGNKPAKKNKEKSKKEKPSVATVEELPINNPARLDIRVGKIVQVKNHDNADSLYVEQIDLGEDSPRTVVSGLVKHIPIEEMRNRLVVVLCNLKAANMRGVKSEGMVLAATGNDGKVELLAPHANSKPGDRIVFQGFEKGNPDTVLNPKKKVWETIQPGLFTNENRVACYKKSPIENDQGGTVHEMMTFNGMITAQTVTQASIK